MLVTVKKWWNIYKKYEKAFKTKKNGMSSTGSRPVLTCAGIHVGRWRRVVSQAGNIAARTVAAARVGLAGTTQWKRITSIVPGERSKF